MVSPLGSRLLPTSSGVFREAHVMSWHVSARLVPRLASQLRHTKRNRARKCKMRKKTNNIEVFGRVCCDGGLMIVCFHRSLLPYANRWWAQAGEQREHKHHQPQMPVDVIARHGEGREEGKRPRRQASKKEKPEKLSTGLCTAPESVKCSHATSDSG